jgi:hypothetical protein
MQSWDCSCYVGFDLEFFFRNEENGRGYPVNPSIKRAVAEQAGFSKGATAGLICSALNGHAPMARLKSHSRSMSVIRRGCLVPLTNF